MTETVVMHTLYTPADTLEVAVAPSRMAPLPQSRLQSAEAYAPPAIV